MLLQITHYTLKTDTIKLKECKRKQILHQMSFQQQKEEPYCIHHYLLSYFPNEFLFSSSFVTLISKVISRIIFCCIKDIKKEAIMFPRDIYEYVFP